jgi:diguanylate cyclase (GGDEF)-like protein
MKHLTTSLRARYLLFAITMATAMLVAAFWAYGNLSTTRTETASNLVIRNQLVDKARQIRLQLFIGYQSIDVFLLEPELELYRTRATESITQAIQSTSQLASHPWVIANQQTGLVEALRQRLTELQHETTSLFIIRKDIEKQYPSLAVGGNAMQPNRNRFNNAIAVAMNEVHQESRNIKDPEVYEAIETTRYLWTQVLSNFRLYLANRVGSFSEESLPVQETGIETMYGELDARLQELATMDQAGRLGFETSAAVEEMVDAGAKWFAGFQEVKKIHNSGEWRLDSKIMRETIAPLVGKISSQLELLENLISDFASQDVKLVSDAASRQSLVLWLMAGSGLFFIIVVVISMEALLFRPLATVVHALKAEAFGKEISELPDVRSRETQNLVDAFTEMRKQVHNRQTELEYQATHDALTALPNRVLLYDRIDHDIALGQRMKQQLALLIIDLDRFKEVNDTLGHHVGDKLLVDVGARFKSVLRDIDTVARLGGDEFAVLLPGNDTDAARHVAEKLTEALAQVFNINTLQLYIDASIGIAMYPEHGKDAQTLMKHADVAMYVAKHSSLDYAFYNPEEDQHSVRHLAMLSDIREAIEQDLLGMQYQPKMDVRYGKIISVEALLRWHSSVFGNVPPLQIIEIAERTGLIHPLTNWVINHALHQCRQWHDRGYEFGISVNLSVHNLWDPDLVNYIESKINEYGLPAASLCLEITESAMMANPGHAIDVLTSLKKMGVRLSIDDFGSGFSSLVYIKQLPVHELKIDKSFIFDMDKDTNDIAIVRSTIDLAHNLNLDVVAEGVETDRSLAALSQMGCDIAQGHYISKPLVAEELEAWLTRHAASLQLSRTAETQG